MALSTLSCPFVGESGPLKGWVWSNGSELALFMSTGYPNSDDCFGSLEVVSDLTFHFLSFSFASSFF